MLAPSVSSSPRRPLLLPCAAIVLLSFAYRLPPLINARTVDADAAVVGLQASHILHGEASPFLWGSGYQTSVDSFVAALFFVPLDATPLALLLSTLCGHVVSSCLAFLTLTRRVSRGAAFVLTLPLVFTSCPLHTYILNAPRQASLTIVFLAVFLLDGGYVYAGALVASLACFADPYGLLFLPSLLLLGFLASQGETPRKRLLPVVSGALIGILPLGLLLASPRSVHGETTLTLSVVPHNLALLVDPCLPWVLGASAWAPGKALGWTRWDGGPVARGLAEAGGLAFVLAVLSGGVLLFWKRLAWPTRRLGVFGFLGAVTTVLAFLVSTMVMDLFSARYLAALVLLSPFAMAPLGAVMGAGRSLVLLAPFLVGSAISGWVGYGPLALPGHGSADEDAMASLLERRGVHAAIADYWVSYRLTFLAKEALTVVPLHLREDRYPPYRDAYAAATRTAYIFDPERSREDLASTKKELFEGASPWGKVVGEVHLGRLTAIVFDKEPGKAPSL